MNKVHFVEYDEGELAYFPYTKRFFKINDKAKNLINCIVDGQRREETKELFHLSDEEYDKYYDNIHTRKIPKYDGENNNEAQTIKKQKILPRLVIHLSNTCNLRCVYCYANGGVYKSNEGLLTSKTLDKILDVFYRRFDVISSVQFFGGEPFLNIPILEEACRKIRKIDMERGYSTLFGVVTNGTILNQHIIELIKKYDLNVTISYDGFPSVNNISRIDANGNGTSEIILRNAKIMKKETQEPSTIEVTYNQYHVDQNVTPIDVVKHINKELPNTAIHLIPAGGSESDDFVVKDLGIFAKSVDDMFEAIKETNETEGAIQIPSYSLIERLLNGLSDKSYYGSSVICNAGLGTISVSIKGDVYPCFMFTDDEEMCLGNIFDDKLFDSDKYKKLTDKLNNFSVKDNNSECQNCFINTLCNGCLGLNSCRTGSPFKLSEELCQMFRDMTDRVLVDYVKYSEDVSKPDGISEMV